MAKYKVSRGFGSDIAEVTTKKDKFFVNEHGPFAIEEIPDSGINLSLVNILDQSGKVIFTIRKIGSAYCYSDGYIEIEYKNKFKACGEALWNKGGLS